MINWFGPRSWGAPVCADSPRCAPPVDAPCVRCHCLIAEHDEGIVMPGSDGPVAFHLACHLKSVVLHRMWADMGLVPDASDGLVNGYFECRRCGVAYREGVGWIPGGIHG